MSHLQYYAYEKFGVRQREVVGYSQAVRVGDRIEVAGQGMCRLFFFFNMAIANPSF